MKPHHHEVNHVHGVVRTAPILLPMTNSDGDDVTMEERVRFNYDVVHMSKHEEDELSLTKHLNDSLVEE